MMGLRPLATLLPPAWSALLTALLTVFLASPGMAYEKRFMCGTPPGSTYTDDLGHVFVRDVAYTAQNAAGYADSGATSFALPDPTWKPVGGTLHQPLYEWGRYNWTRYKFDVPNGDYIVKLHFADILSHGVGQRIQTISIEGQVVLNLFDVYAVVGDHYAVIYPFRAHVTDGQLNVTAVINRQPSMLSAIEVVSAPPDLIAPPPPTGLTMWRSFGRNMFDWNNGAAPDLAGYHLERSLNTNGPWMRIPPLYGPLQRRSRAEDATAASQTQYYYRVIAEDAWDNESGPSIQVSGMILPDNATDLPIYQIGLSTTNYATLNANVESDEYVSGTFTYNGQTWSNVGLRYRGRTSRSVSKKSWKVKFDKFDQGQTFLNGQRELNLSSQFGERTMLRNSLGWELCRRVGIESANSGHVLLKVASPGGAPAEYYGVYDSIESIDSRWLSNHGYPPGGTLYKADSTIANLSVLADTALYERVYQQETNEQTSHADLIQFIQLINQTAPEQIWNTMAPIFDLEGFINYHAAMAALQNDSFSSHNYYLYHDLANNFWYWIPWDLDSTFGHLSIFSLDVVTDQTPLHGNNNVLIYYLQASPHFRRRLLERTIEIMTENLTPQTFNGAVDSAWSYMREEARLDWRKWGWESPAAIDSAAIEIKSFIPARLTYIQSVVPSMLEAIPQSIFINEILADNDGGLQDEAGEREDWIEIVNLGSQPASLAGCYLTDEIDLPTMWAIPDTTIPAGGHILFWCDEEPAEGPAHTNFALDKNGDWIGLYGPTPGGNRPIDSKGFGNQIKDVSFGRFADGNWDWMLMGSPTPRAANSNQGNLPPTITNVNHFPQSPGLNTPVTVTARIIDGGSVASAKVLYKPGATFLDEVMRDDGQEGDQTGGDNLWTAVLPGQPQPVVVPYYILATDNQGREATDPIDAPDDTHVYSVGYVAPLLKINEFLALNTNIIQDEFGEFADYIEIYNAGSVPVQMLGMGLSDEFDNPDEYVFPDTVLGPGNFLLIWADDDPEQGPFHAAFGLSGARDEICLYSDLATGHAIIDSLSFGQQYPNISCGRWPDGNATFLLFVTPTPNGPNTVTGVDGQPAGQLPLRLVLGAGRPNPAPGGRATIPFGLPTRGRARLVIYDIAGRAVARLLDEVLEPGFHEAEWDGGLGVARGGRSGSAPAGVYFYRLDFAGEARTGKLTIVR
jgi:CotH kinase protein/Malectin domain/Lamin Tail Domain